MRLSPFKLRRAVQALQSGGVIAYPTEAVFGLGCDPLNAHAVERILQLKHRPMHKGLILIAASQAQIEPFVQPIPPSLQQRLDETWPGPTTWLLPKSPDCPDYLSGDHPSLAVRVTSHPLVVQLCEAFDGPLVSTSANRAGQEPARSARQTRLIFRDELEHIVHAPTGGRTQPSDIIDALSGRYIRN